MILSPPLLLRDTPLDVHLDELVRRSREGDLEAFDALVGRYYRMVFGIAYRMLHGREEAEDATQEIFIKAWRNLSRFRNASRFTTWLHSIAVRHCLDVARKRSREAARTEPAPPEEGADLDRSAERDPSMVPGSAQWNLCRSVQDAVERLPEDQKVVVILHYLAGYSVEEIASSLNLHPNTIYSRLNKSLSRLKREVGDMEIRR